MVRRKNIGNKETHGNALPTKDQGNTNNQWQ